MKNMMAFAKNMAKIILAKACIYIVHFSVA
jgi:hypothetical protein